MNQKKRLKGMTLLEIIISIAIYAILALLVTEIMTCVNATMHATAQLNDRLSHEAKYADNLILKDEDGDFDKNTALKTTIHFGTDYVNSAHGAYSIDATEYTTHYTRKLPDGSAYTGKVYNEKTNYRFMVFSKVGFVTPPPTGTRTVTIRARGAAVPAMTKYVVKGNHYKQGETNYVIANMITTDETVTAVSSYVDRQIILTIVLPDTETTLDVDFFRIMTASDGTDHEVNYAPAHFTFLSDVTYSFDGTSFAVG